MIKAAILSVCLAVSSLSLNARAQDVRAYSYGAVTSVFYIHVEYGHFEEYVAWVTSTWVPIGCMDYLLIVTADELWRTSELPPW